MKHSYEGWENPKASGLTQSCKFTSFQHLEPFNLTTVCFCCCVVSSICSPFRRLYQADHIAEGKARPQHWERHALLFRIVCGFFYIPQNCKHSRVVRRGLRLIVVIREWTKFLFISKFYFEKVGETIKKNWKSHVFFIVSFLFLSCFCHCFSFVLVMFWNFALSIRNFTLRLA